MIDILICTTSKHVKCGVLLGRSRKTQCGTQKITRGVVEAMLATIQIGGRIVKMAQMIMRLCTLKNKLARCLKYFITEKITYRNNSIGNTYLFYTHMDTIERLISRTSECADIPNQREKVGFEYVTVGKDWEITISRKMKFIGRQLNP